MDRIIVTRPYHGLVAMQVCAVADATDEEILKACNAQSPSGTTNGWSRVIHNDPLHPGRNPVACSDYPERIHYLVVC